MAGLLKVHFIKASHRVLAFIFIPLFQFKEKKSVKNRNKSLKSMFRRGLSGWVIPKALQPRQDRKCEMQSIYLCVHSKSEQILRMCKQA